MKNNLVSLSKNPYIVEIKELVIDADRKKFWGPELTKKALANSKDVWVYRMVYKSQNHKVVGYIVEPKKGNNLPCIIRNRGGSGDFGSINVGQLFTSHAFLAKNGYIVISSQYSGAAGSDGVDDFGGKNLEDILVLYKILKQYKRADVKRIGMFGASRGGCMTYMINAKVTWLKAIATQAGLADLFRNEKERGVSMKKNYDERFGASKAERTKRSALHWPEKFPKKIPVLLMHGTADWRVNCLDSIELATKLYEQKVPVKLVLFPGGDHSLTEYREEMKMLYLYWFNKYVKNREKLPNLTPHGE